MYPAFENKTISTQNTLVQQKIQVPLFYKFSSWLPRTI